MLERLLKKKSAHDSGGSFGDAQGEFESGASMLAAAYHNAGAQQV